MLPALGTLLFIVMALISMSVRILQEYERGVVFRLGRVLKTPKGPGLILLIPFLDKMIRVSTRIITMDIEPQDIISQDNISLKVNAVVYFRVIDPVRAVINIENYLYATSQLSQTHLRSILGEHSLDQLLGERERINVRLQKILDDNTDAWGIKVTSVEIKHIDLPTEMQRAMARQAEAERDRRAKVIAAEGELQASKMLTAASEKMSTSPMTLQLRYMQTLADIATENSSTVVFPIPMDMFKPFLNAVGGGGGGQSEPSAPTAEERQEAEAIVDAAPDIEPKVPGGTPTP